MKKIFLLLFLLTGIFHIKGQTSIATLCHNETITTYYGSDALIEAHSAAVDGDVITLSSGFFKAVTITKYITIKGSGMEVLNLGDRMQEPTVLSGAFSFMLTADSTKTVTMEGICHEDSYINMKGIYNTTFIKCSIGEFREYSGGAENVNFIHCKIYSFTSPEVASISAYNSYFENFICKTGYGINAGYNFTNCIINTDFSNFYNSYLVNCILLNLETTSSGLKNSVSAYNCIWQGKAYTDTGAFGNAAANQNSYEFPDDQKLFLDNTFYELTDVGKTYQATDGTEIGLYGGNMPYNPIPFNLQITKCNVAAKTTADGKLSIEIEVKNME